MLRKLKCVDASNIAFFVMVNVASISHRNAPPVNAVIVRLLIARNKLHLAECAVMAKSSKAALVHGRTILMQVTGSMSQRSQAIAASSQVLKVPNGVSYVMACLTF